MTTETRHLIKQANKVQRKLEIHGFTAKDSGKLARDQNRLRYEIVRKTRGKS